jgi:hypothetical protein
MPVVGPHLGGGAAVGGGYARRGGARGSGLRVGVRQKNRRRAIDFAMGSQEGQLQR